MCLQGRDKDFSNWRIGPWLISEDEGKWQFVGGRIGGRVVREFGHREEVYPFLGVSITKDMKVGFKLLAHPLCFSIGLWVVDRGEFKVVL